MSVLRASSRSQVTDIALGYAEPFGEIRPALFGRSDIVSVFGGELAGPAVRKPTFPPSVIQIHGLGAEEKVSIIAARRVVATVAHANPIWDGPIREGVGETMGQNGSAGLCHEDAVSSGVNTAIPRPTFIGACYGNFLPESVHSGSREYLCEPTSSAFCVVVGAAKPTAVNSQIASSTDGHRG